MHPDDDSDDCDLDEEYGEPVGRERDFWQS